MTLRLQMLERESASLRELSRPQAADAAGASRVAVARTTLSQVRQDVADLDQGTDRRIRHRESNVSKLHHDMQTLQSRLRLR